MFSLFSLNPQLPLHMYIHIFINFGTKKKLYKENVCLNQYLIVRCFIRTGHYHQIYYSPAGEKRKTQLHERKKITIKKKQLQKSVM